MCFRKLLQQLVDAYDWKGILLLTEAGLLATMTYFLNIAFS